MLIHILIIFISSSLRLLLCIEDDSKSEAESAFQSALALCAAEKSDYASQSDIKLLWWK